MVSSTITGRKETQKYFENMSFKESWEKIMNMILSGDDEIWNNFNLSIFVKEACEKAPTNEWVIMLLDSVEDAMGKEIRRRELFLSPPKFTKLRDKYSALPSEDVRLAIEKIDAEEYKIITQGKRVSELFESLREPLETVFKNDRKLFLEKSELICSYAEREELSIVSDFIKGISKDKLEIDLV